MAWLQPNTSTDIGTSQYQDALLEYNYHLMVEGKLTGIFLSLSGGEIEIAYAKHDVVYESGLSTTLFVPGPTSYAPFKLGRGFGNYVELHNWLVEASEGRIISARRNGSVVMRKHVNGVYTDIFRWDFENAWPTKLESFALSQKEGTIRRVAKVGLTIVAESIKQVDP